MIICEKLDTGYYMQVQLMSYDEEDEKSKLHYQKIVHQYYLNRRKQDQLAGSYIKNQVLKALFNILLKLSYGLFILGAVLTIDSKAFDQQQIIQYLSSTRNKTILIVLIFLGVIILTLLRHIKEDSSIPPQVKKIMNFITDIFRTIFYTLTLIFVGPYVHDNNDTLLTVSFYTFIAALGLFIIRKSIKWVYYLFDKQGKLIISPWKSKDVESKDNMKNFAEFIQFVLKKQLSGGVMQDVLKMSQKGQKLKSIQEKFLNNLEEKGKLIVQMNKIFSDRTA